MRNSRVVRIHAFIQIYVFYGAKAAIIAVHSAPVALRERILYVRVLQPALHYELEQISKSEILRKLKQRFGAKTIRDVRFRLG